MREGIEGLYDMSIQDRLGTAIVANQREFSPRQTPEKYGMCSVLGLLLCGVKSGA